jgi:hypothetical protein
MVSQSLIIYKFNSLYQILEELSLNLNFKIINLDDENLLNDKIKISSNYLIISDKKNLSFSNQVYLDSKPINISKLIEKINIEFLKLHFNNQSHIKINNYTINLNSREMQLNSKKLKLTEKEINIIIYLIKKNKPVNINELKKNVWSYQPDIETHTVETHIYRLRKKIFSAFNNNEFIVSKKNGYQIE